MLSKLLRFTPRVQFKHCTPVSHGTFHYCSIAAKKQSELDPSIPSILKPSDKYVHIPSYLNIILILI